ncbi:MAG: outer membrane lipoprotein-sorting protein [Treponema sp.]|uniref:outer membrane lipoprotein-sorting protein n=1 Tax=Treponema sp. TaxID=166 RepID=UPI00298D7457|nr:outer membrane lipoprotein-sorting protein [Treponema sp.]MBR0155063.1 outer membrane lipoprotein-sorting protein [Treponema sp.]MCR5386427.1 outer membrane lipoprotein-sorting protein [Treponema sp.]
MNKSTKNYAVLAACVIGMCSAFADAKGNEIMQKVADFKEPQFSQSMVVMTLKNKSGETENRQVVEYGKHDGSKTYVVMDFKGPASVKDTRFLQVTNDNGPDDKWIYLPSLKSVRRVNSSEGSKSFMGTDATYDDLTTRDVSEDEHQYLRDESFTVANGTKYDCHVIKEIPLDKKGTQYNYRMVWVDKKTMYPVHTEMFDKNDKLVKVLEVLKIQNIDGYDIPMENCLKNVQTGHSTTLQVLKVIVDKPLPDRVFTQNFLTVGK